MWSRGQYELATACFQQSNISSLTSIPHLLVPIAITRSVLRPLLLTLLLLAASEHLVEEVELGLGDRHEKEKSPEGLTPALQHSLNNHTDSNCRFK